MAQLNGIVNPYEPRDSLPNSSGFSWDARERGPAIYLIAGGVIAAITVLPMHFILVLESQNIVLLDNAFLFVLGGACAIVLLGIPFGGIAYRIRSRNWPIDPAVRSRQIWFSVATLILPIVTALLCLLLLHSLPSNRLQAILLTLFAFLMSCSLTVGVYASGIRRQQKTTGNQRMHVRTGKV